jgi:hypothetical protein
MIKNMVQNVWVYVRAAAWVYIAIGIMKVAEHFGASQVEAAGACVVATIMYVFILLTDVLSELAPELDKLIADWRRDRER